MGSEPRLAQSQNGGMWLFSEAMLSRRAWGSVVWALAGLCIVYPVIWLTREGKSRKNLRQGIRKSLGRPAPNAIRLVDVAIPGDGINCPARHCRPWLSRQATALIIGRRKYLPSCRTRGSPRPLILSQSSQLCLRCGRQTTEHPNPRVSACYLRSRGTNCKLKTLGF